MLSWPIPFLSPCSFRPPCWLGSTTGESFFHPPMLEWFSVGVPMRVGMDYFVLNVHVPVSVSSGECGSGGELCQCIRCHYYSVHQDNENQALILQPCAIVRLETILRQSGSQWWRKMDKSQIRRKRNVLLMFFSFFLFFFFNWLVGVTRVWICWQYGLPGIVGLLVGVPGCRRERRWEWIPTCTVWSGWKAIWMMWACTSAPMYFVSAPPKT